MEKVLHKSFPRRPVQGLRRVIFCTCLVLTVAALQGTPARAQGYPGSGRGAGPITGSGGRSQQEQELPSNPSEPNPEKVSSKAYAAGMKTMGKAHEQEQIIATTTDPEKKGKAAEKLDNLYGRALDQFTEVLRYKSEMYDAWNQVGYVHFKLGAYRESIDDYDHALALKADLTEAIQYRGQAYLAVDRLEEAKAAYMELFFHDRPRADTMMTAMQAWLQSHRIAANGVRAGDIDGFDKWLQERDAIAKTAS